MADVATINTKLRGFIREVLAMPENSVRPANQNAPAGPKDEQYATVLVTLVESTGQDDYRLENEPESTNINETVLGQRRLVASIQFFRGDAYTKACRLRTAVARPSSTDKLNALGFGFVKASAARNLTATVDTYWEERGQIDLEFHLIAQETESVPTFGRFQTSVSTGSSTTSSEVIAP